MAKKNRRETPTDAQRAAGARGLFVLISGAGRSAEYKTWDRRTGKWVLTYYPASKRWMAQHDREGGAEDYISAIAAVLDGVAAGWV